MPRFIHTSDWQLGKSIRILNPEAHGQYSQARIDVIRTIGRLAEEEKCSFIAVAGDVFEYEQMDRGTVFRALEAMGECGVPVVLLPGNHDPHHDDSVYMSRVFAERAPKNVVILSDSKPIHITDDTEVVGAPWHSKHPVGNPVIAALDRLGPAEGFFRICLAHGYADIRSFSPGKEALIPVDMLEKAIAQGKIHYAALGDKHSCDVLDREGRIRYSGTPEPTDFDEIKPGHVCIVDLSVDGIAIDEHPVGVWKFLKLDREFSGTEDTKNILRELKDVADKPTTIVRLEIAGSLGLAEDEALRNGLEDEALLFAGLEVRRNGYFVNPGNFETLCSNLGGYAAEAAESLRVTALAGGDGARAAGDALLLLARLTSSGKESGS